MQWRSNRQDRSDNVRPIIIQKKKKLSEEKKKTETKNHERPMEIEETFEMEIKSLIKWLAWL